MRRSMVLVIVAIAAIATAATYAQATRPYRVYGIGSVSCGSWTKTTKDDTYRWWVFGYVSGANRAGMELRETDPDAIGAWMDKYCADHPLDQVVTAAHKLVDELRQH